MIRNLFIAFLLVFSTNLFAQTSFDEKMVNKMNRELERNKLNEGSGEVKLYKNVFGSPYLNDSLIDGVISGKYQEEIKGKYRYNIYSDEVEYLQERKIFAVKEPYKYIYFTIGETKLQFLKYNEDKKIKSGYLIVLSEGKYTLLHKLKVKYLPEEDPQPYIIPKPNRFEPGEDAFYVTSNNNPAVKITSVKALKKEFPELGTIIDSYKESTSIKKKKNFISLIEYINSQAI
ncbi:MAG: hypothetical protein AB9846_06690 [Tenuifilaceae bacterium]